MNSNKSTTSYNYFKLLYDALHFEYNERNSSYETINQNYIQNHFYKNELIKESYIDCNNNKKVTENIKLQNLEKYYITNKKTRKKIGLKKLL